MFGKTVVADSLVAWVVGGVLSGAKNKILSKIHGNERPENYEAEIYNVTENTIRNICMIRDKEALPELVETFLSKILNENTVSTSTIKKSLKSIAGDMVIDDEFCEYFRRRLYGEISRNDKLSHWLQLNMITGIVSNIGTVLDGVEEVNNKLDEFVGFASNRDASEMANAILKFDDDKQYYIDGKWNARLFLHIGENDKPLTLKNTFIAPDYEVNHKLYESNLIERLVDFIEKGDGSVIITGAPGIGKTSVIACLANHYKESNNVLILRFKQLNGRIKSNNDLLSSVCDYLTREEKNRIETCNLKQKTLILDGFDEFRTEYDKQELIKIFLLDVLNIEGFKVIITTRNNYIEIRSLKAITKMIINLKPYSELKIQKFYKGILGIPLKKNVKIKNREVLGIPVILYLALAVGIDITIDASKFELYEKIFSLESGIYNRFRNNSINCKGYEQGSHLVEYSKEKFYRILQLLAFEIFERDNDSIETEDYIKIVNAVYVDKSTCKKLNERVVLDFPIKSLYEMSDNIEFVHRSIYEYFVADFIFHELLDAISNNKSSELANALGKTLKKNRLSVEIKDFLKFKLFESVRDSKNLFLEAFDKMLKNGMTYYTKKKYTNIIDLERTVFFNVLEILHFWECKNGEYLNFSESHIFQYYCHNQPDIDLSNLYLEKVNFRSTDLEKVDFSGAVLANADFMNAYLKEANLSGAELKGAVLSRAFLRRAKLMNAKLNKAFLLYADLGKANLSKADLSQAKLMKADLTNAILCDADLTGVDLKLVDLSNADLTGAIFDLENIIDLEKMYSYYKIRQVCVRVEDDIIDYEKLHNYNTWSSSDGT